MGIPHPTSVARQLRDIRSGEALKKLAAYIDGDNERLLEVFKQFWDLGAFAQAGNSDSDDRFLDDIIGYAEEFTEAELRRRGKRKKVRKKGEE